MKAIDDYEGLCFKCLGKKPLDKITTIEFKDMGYGSNFDGMESKIQLCDECKSKTNKEWWKMNIVELDYGVEEYEYDEEIYKYINELPIESQELFYNTIDLNCSFNMDSQDWIDRQSGTMSIEKLKEYGFIDNGTKMSILNRIIKGLTK